MSSSGRRALVAAAAAVVCTVVLVVLSKSIAWGVVVGLVALAGVAVLYIGVLCAARRGVGAASASEGELASIIEGMSVGEEPDLSAIPGELGKALGNLSARINGLSADVDALSPRDELTSLAKEDVFNNVLWREFNRAQRYSEPMSLALLEIKGLSGLRSARGADAVDAVLKRVASLVLQMIRETDLGARYGEDQLAVIMPGTDGAGADEFAHRFQKSVAEAKADLQDAGEGVSISIGVSSVPGEGIRTTPDLVQKAAEALGASKGAGGGEGETG